jgi:hypothetical protein
MVADMNSGRQYCEVNLDRGWQNNLQSVKDDTIRKAGVRENLRYQWGCTKEEIAGIETKVPDLRLRAINPIGDIKTSADFAVSQAQYFRMPIVLTFNCRFMVVKEGDTADSVVSDYRQQIDKLINRKKDTPSAPPAAKPI